MQLEVLEVLGIGSISKISQEVEAIVSPGGETVPDEMGFTRCAHRAIEYAAKEAHRSNHSADAGYLLLGLISEDEHVATRVLTKLRVDPTGVRSQIIPLLGRSREERHVFSEDLQP